MEIYGACTSEIKSPTTAGCSIAAKVEKGN